MESLISLECLLIVLPHTIVIQFINYKQFWISCRYLLNCDIIAFNPAEVTKIH